MWSDLVCPWCYIGKRQLDLALEQFEHADQVDVTWRSFELTPNEQTEPYLLDDYLANSRGMDAAEIAEKHERVTSIAAEIGLEYRLDLAQLGNTFDGHRLIHLAADEGLQAEANERLLRAYMTEGRAISDRETLADLAAEIGIDREQAKLALETGLHAEDVRNDERTAGELGISGGAVLRLRPPLRGLGCAAGRVPAGRAQPVLGRARHGGHRRLGRVSAAPPSSTGKRRPCRARSSPPGSPS